MKGDNFSRLCIVHLLSGTATNNDNVSAATIYEMEVMICLQLLTNMSFLFIVSLYILIGRAANNRNGSDYKVQSLQKMCRFRIIVYVSCFEH